MSNAGSITAGAGGYVALLGGQVSNSGTISVPLGKVALGAGEAMTLDLNGDGFLQVAVPAAIVTDGMALGDRVSLKVGAVRNAVRRLVNVSESLAADSVVGSDGAIVLEGSTSTGSAALNPASLANSGTITASGGRVALTSAGTLDHSGSIDTDSATGNGGRIDLFGYRVTTTGALSARATGATGNGGFVETSGNSIDFGGVKVDTSAAHGASGTWLIDPVDLTIDVAAASTISTNLATGNVTVQTTASTATSPGVQSGTSGDIFVNSAITWTSANTLSVLAYRNIAINAAITGTSGGLTLTAGNGVANSGSISATGAVNVGTFNLTNGTWSQVAATLPAFAARDFRFTPASANFLRATGGAGTSGSPYAIADIYGLQGIASSSLLAQNFVLANTIDASGTLSWNAGAGFIAIGTSGSGGIWNGSTFVGGGTTGFTGALDGAGFTISGLTINRSTISYQGLVGYVSASAAINNVTLTGLVITSAAYSGGLVGYVNGAGAIVTNSSAAGTLSGTNYIGGLVGNLQLGQISGSHASVAVTGSSFDVGGLVGSTSYNTVVTNSYGTGNVTGSSSTGGLVGYHQGMVSYSYATGNVTATGYVGGLVGTSNGGAVNNVYATGNVTATGAGNVNAGGLVGEAMYQAAISNAYATGSVTAVGQNVGGLVGELYGFSSGTFNTSITNSYASGSVSGGGVVGGLVGSVAGVASATNSYWDSYSTGRGTSFGSNTGTVTNVNAVSSDPAQSAAANYAYKAAAYASLTAASGIGTATPTGFVFMPGNRTRPFLAFEVPTLAVAGVGSNIVVRNSHQLQLIGYNGTTLAASYLIGNNISLAETGAVVLGNAATYAGLWAGTGWVAIGTDGAGSIQATNGFVGSLDGQNHTISGLTIAGTSSSIGLIGYVNGTATALSNIVLSSVKVSGSANAGGLVGVAAAGAIINNVSVAGTVSGSNNVGLLAGNFGGTSITNSSSSGSVSGSQATGGLIGRAGSSSIDKSSSSATVTGTSSSTGGLVGLYLGSTTITNAFATGDVTGTTAVGGLVGGTTTGFTSTIANSYATGNVKGSLASVGGLAGVLNSVDVSQSYATGTVTNTRVGGSVATGGLIGTAGGGTIDLSYATGKVSSTAATVGGLVGQISNTALTRSYATGAVSGVAIVGGLVGTVNSFGSSIRDAYATGSVTATSDRAGGLIGSVNSGLVTNAYATGSVTSAGLAGGVVGMADTSTATSITSVYASGAVSGGTGMAGGIAGSGGGNIANSYWDTNSTGQGNAAGTGTLGANVSSVTSGTTTPTAYMATSYANLTAGTGVGTATPTGFVFAAGNSTRPFLAFEVPTAAVAGTNASGQVYVTNAHQLQLIGYNATTNAASYTLSGNINLSETGAVVVGTASSYAGLWAGTGFVPLGTDGVGNVWNGSTYALLSTIAAGAVHGFSGSLDGGGYTISNLTINRGTVKNVALFGLSSGAIGNVTVGGAVTGLNGVGGLIGQLYGTGSVTLSSSTANVSGNNLVGGLVGNAGDGSSISRSSASGTITGAGDVGGLVGYASGATIGRSFATGTVSGVNYAGGLIGYQYNGATSNSYATGTVTATASTAGGLIGHLNGGTLLNSYAANQVMSPGIKGGLLGQSAAGASVTSSYWDTTVSGLTTSAGGTGHTTAEMQETVLYPLIYQGWEFTTIWSPPTTGNYPKLR